MAALKDIAKELTRLKVITVGRNQDGDDVAAQLAAMAEGLEDFNLLSVVRGCEAWARRNKFFPTLAELRDECARHEPRREALPPPKRAPINDKQWWYDWCESHPDPGTLARGRELYPSMFWNDGSLLPRNMVAFGQQDRQAVAVDQSVAYGHEINP